MSNAPMSMEQAAAFFVFALVAAITPGPSNVLLTATGAAVGVTRGLGVLFGVSAGMASMMFLAAVGLGGAVADHAGIMAGIRYGGAALLLWLAWKIASAGPGGRQAPAARVGYFDAAALQWVNPKSWLVSTGAVATYLDPAPGGALLQGACLALVFVAAALPSGLVWLAFGAAAQRLLANERHRRGFNIAMGAALAASVAMMVW